MAKYQKKKEKPDKTRKRNNKKAVLSETCSEYQHMV